MSQVFISYKTEDRARVALIVKALERDGIDIWWDQMIPFGSAWRETIVENLDEAKCVVVFWSELAVSAVGEFVKDEAARAQRSKKYLPVLIDNVEIPLGFGQTQACPLINYRDGSNSVALRQLIERIRLMIGTETSDSAPAMPVYKIASRRQVLVAGTGIAVTAIAAGVAIAPDDTFCRFGFCAATARPNSIAVLPFRNLSADPTQDYFSDGLSEDLRSALSKQTGIQVSARASSSTFKGKEDEIDKIADALNVSYILDGSVRKSENSVRVRAALIDADSSFERWSESYDKNFDDIFSVQSSIASSVVAALVGEMSNRKGQPIEAAPTSNKAAYDAYLKGRHNLDLSGDESTYRLALKNFELAISLDPRFAGAHAARARTLAALANQFEPAERLRPVYDEALKSARSAVSLDPNLADAQSALGYVYANGRLEFPAARASYRRSVKADPNNADILIRFGLFECRAGDMKAGLAALTRSIVLDPLNPRAYKAYGQALFSDRQFEPSIDALKKALSLNKTMNSAHAGIGDNLLFLNDVSGAVREYKSEPQDLTRLTGLAIALNRAGDFAGAVNAFDELVRVKGDSAAYQKAQILAQWRKPVEAVDALERAKEVGDAGLIYLRDDPMLDPVRKEVGFITLSDQLGIAVPS